MASEQVSPLRGDYFNRPGFTDARVPPRWPTDEERKKIETLLTEAAERGDVGSCVKLNLALCESLLEVQDYLGGRDKLVVLWRLARSEALEKCRR